MRIQTSIFVSLICLLLGCKKNEVPAPPEFEDVLTEHELQIWDAAPLDTTTKFEHVLFSDGRNIRDWALINDPGFVPTFTRGLQLNAASDKKDLFVERMTKNGLILTDDSQCSCTSTQENGLAYVYGSKNITTTYLHPEAKCRERLYGLDCSGMIYQMALGCGLNFSENGTWAFADVANWNNAFNNSQDFQSLEMNDQGFIPASQFEPGDIVVRKGKHIGMIYKRDNVLGILNSQGSPDSTCEANKRKGRGPVTKTNISSWLNSLFQNNYIVLRPFLTGRPGVVTSPVTNIVQFSASSGGAVTNIGGSAVSERGVCWSTAPSPTVSNNKTIDGSGPGSFSSTITGLTANTRYYVRAYATNTQGTSYGTENSFTTLPNVSLPTPRAFWSFDDCSPNDFSGNNLHGTFQQPPPICQSGVASNSVTFKNPLFFQPQGFITPFTLGLSPTAFSVSFWVKFVTPTTFSPLAYLPFFILSNNPSPLHIWSHYDLNNPAQSYWSVETGPGNPPAVVHYTNPDWAELNNGSWHHFAISCSNGSVSFYKNGSLLSTFGISAPGYSGIILEPTLQHNVCFDQVRVYNASLSGAQVQYLFNNHL